MCEHHAVVPVSRRGLILGIIALGTAPFWSRLALAAQEITGTAPNAIGPEAALQRLIEGNARHVANEVDLRDFAAGRAARAQAQYPIAAILSCADSRVAPEFAFDQGPGELFVVRIAGNFVEDDGLASLEYAVQFLGVQLIMVLGHSSCGAVDAAIKVLRDGAELPGHLPGLIESIAPAVEIAIERKGPDLLADAIAENVRRNVGLLKSAQSIVSTAVADGRIGVVGGVYDLATGKVTLL